MPERSAVRTVVRRHGDATQAFEDEVAVEEPLEIRVQGETLALTMRTPGDDHALAIGFLVAEGLVTRRDDLGTVAHCGRPGDEGYGNVIDVLPGAGVAFDLERMSATRRGTLTTSACGVCGRRSIDDLRALTRGELPEGTLPAHVVRDAPSKLRESQATFARTGGLHGAAILDASGAVLAAAEDVGRHNAVDKVIGALVLSGRMPIRAPLLLVVSGRASFEIVQKAAVARLVAVAAVSAPSSLAVDLAMECGVALACFVRDGSMNVYAHGERLS